MNVEVKLFINIYLMPQLPRLTAMIRLINSETDETDKENLLKKTIIKL